MNVPWTAATAQAIGLVWLQGAISPISAFGRRHAAQQQPYVPGDEVAAQAAAGEVWEAARQLQARDVEALRALIAQAPEVEELLARAGAGEGLRDGDLFDVTRLLDVMADAALRTRHAVFGALAIEAAPNSLSDLLRVGRTATGTFYLDDAFAPELSVARAAATAEREAYEALRARLETAVAAYAAMERLPGDTFILMREQLRGPLPAAVRVVREAATYLLCELALDDAGRTALERCEAAERRLFQEEERIRVGLAAAVAAGAAALETGVRALGALDVFIARVRFAQKHATVVPEVVAAPSISFAEGSYLPLGEALHEYDRPYVPISLTLEGVGVVTGPNMGGKTAALRTAGFIAACVAFGLPVPARSARVGLFDEVAWLGLGDTPEGDVLLSSFASEIVSLHSFFERATQRPLVLIDEFARTTSPREARALLVAVLRSLAERGACALAATHLDLVATDAGATHFRVCPERHQVVCAQDGAVSGAGALELAESLGLDATLLAVARRYL